MYHIDRLDQDGHFIGKIETSSLRKVKLDTDGKKLKNFSWISAKVYDNYLDRMNNNHRQN